MGTFTTRLAAQAVSDSAASKAYCHSDNYTPLGTAAQQLVELNFRYLPLAATCPEFSGAIAAQLTDSGPEQRLRMADCRFSLFSLALNDSRRWLPLLSRGVINSPLRVIDSPDKAFLKEFCMLAVFLAWHFAQSQPLAAKVLLGMGDDVAAALARIPVAHLPSIADNAADWLVPRWSQHPIFWSALLCNSRDPAAGDLTAIKSLGPQLLAAETLALRITSKVASRGQLSSSLGGQVPKSSPLGRSLSAERPISARGRPNDRFKAVANPAFR